MQLDSSVRDQQAAETKFEVRFMTNKIEKIKNIANKKNLKFLPTIFFLDILRKKGFINFFKKKKVYNWLEVFVSSNSK